MKNIMQITNSSFEIYNNGGSYINQQRMFHAYFNTISNVKSLSNINVKQAKKFVAEKFANLIVDEKYHIEYKQNMKISDERDYFFIFNNQMIVNFCYDSIYVLFESTNEMLATEIINNSLQFIIKKKKAKEIGLIISTKLGLQTKSIAIKKPNLNIDLHYNDNFKIVHELVLQSIKQEKQKGLYLFHGLPGTGKSTYIKYLIHQQKKEVIFLSPKMAANLDNLAFTEFLLDNPNIVLVIEDAEELIVSRDKHQNSQLSFLLNLTDGLIADSLGIQIIATFNTNIQNIDKALMRKGRLTAIYEFKELEAHKVKTLFNQLEIDNVETCRSMTLAEIFNYKADNFVLNKEKVKIGF